MTTTAREAAPVVDRLFGFVAHLARHNHSDLAEHVYAFMPQHDGGLEIRFHGTDRQHVLALAATLTKPVVTGRFFAKDAEINSVGRNWVDLSVRAVAGTVPVVLVIGLDAVEGDTAESVVAAARADLAALVASREG